jgi:hypothetical protein
LISKEKEKVHNFTLLFEEPINELISGGTSSNPFTVASNASTSGGRLVGRTSVGSVSTKHGLQH